MDGTVFARHEFNTEEELAILEQLLDGITLKKVEKPYELVTDLEYYSALDQHIRAGLPLDRPVECPARIEERYEATCAEMNLESNKRDMPYPVSIIKSKMKKRRVTQSMVSSDVTKFSADGMYRLAAVEYDASNSCNMMDICEEGDEIGEKRLREDDKGKGEEVEFYDGLDDDEQTRMPSSPEIQQKQKKQKKSGKVALFESFTDEFF